MSGSVIHSQSAVMVPAVYSAGQPASLPVAIDYPAALALRQMSMVHDELPKYLLAPEVSALLHYVPDLHRKMLLATLWNTGARINEALALRQMSMVHDELPKYLLAPEVSALLHYVPDLHRKMLLATLWNTGARINEALALTRGDFSLAPPYPFVQLATLKQRTEKAARTAGRMPAGQQTHRLVPLSDTWYVSQLQTMVATLKIPMERRNKRTGRTEKARIWEVTDRTVRTWIGEAVAAAAADGVTFSVPVTPHTFRHSYAMHMLYAGIPLKVLQSLMGHKSISSTEVYTKVFALDVAARHRVQFAMPESDAVAMLKQLS